MKKVEIVDYFFFFFLFIFIHFFVVVVVELSRLFFQKNNRHVHSLVHKYVALKHGSIVTVIIVRIVAPRVVKATAVTNLLEIHR